MKDVISHYSSKDFYLVAVCLSAGCKLKSLEKSVGNFVWFVLEESPSICQEIIDKHWSGELMVQSRKLIESINEIKTRLHSLI